METKSERIARMIKNNPSKKKEECEAAVNFIWKEKLKAIEEKIPSRFKHATFESLSEKTKYLKKAIEESLSGNQPEKIGVIFCGQAGSGKTHSAYALIREIAKTNPEAISSMLNYQEAFYYLKKEMFDKTMDELGSVWDELNNESGFYPGLLFIDDLSSKKLTDFEADNLMMFLDRRFNHYFPFLFTTNVPSNEFADIFGERLASRFYGYCKIVNFDEDDLRVNKIEKNQNQDVGLIESS